MKIDEIVLVRDEHIKALSDTLQQSEKDSAMALYGMTAEEAIRSSLDESFKSSTWLAFDKVVSIQGICRPSLLSPFVCPWTLVGDGVKHYPKVFLRGSKVRIENLLDEYGWLKNHVYHKNKDSIRWLKWIGFTIHPAQPLGENNSLFHLIELRK